MKLKSMKQKSMKQKQMNLNISAATKWLTQKANLIVSSYYYISQDYYLSKMS